MPAWRELHIECISRLKRETNSWIAPWKWKQKPGHAVIPIRFWHDTRGTFCACISKLLWSPPYRDKSKNFSTEVLLVPKTFISMVAPLRRKVHRPCPSSHKFHAAPDQLFFPKRRSLLSKKILASNIMQCHQHCACPCHTGTISSLVPWITNLVPCHPWESNFPNPPEQTELWLCKSLDKAHWTANTTWAGSRPTTSRTIGSGCKQPINKSLKFASFKFKNQLQNLYPSSSCTTGMFGVNLLSHMPTKISEESESQKVKMETTRKAA